MPRWWTGMVWTALFVVLFPFSASGHEKNRFRFKNLHVENLVVNGPTRKHVDVVILGDGYIKEDLEPDGSYPRDTKRATEILFSTPPFDLYSNYFNVYAVYAESFDRGAEDRPGEDKKRTILDATFHTQPTRLLTYQREENVIRLAKNAPAADIVLVMVQDARYGGAGGIIWKKTPAPCFSSAEESLQIAVHELGHSFANLADEYVDEASAPRYPLPTGSKDLPFPNVSLKRFIDFTSPQTVKRTVKWRRFIDEGGEGLGQGEKVGAYEGAYFREFGVFRPQFRCKMRAAKDDFCVVCDEEIARAIHKAAKRKFDQKAYRLAIMERRESSSDR